MDTRRQVGLRAFLALVLIIGSAPEASVAAQDLNQIEVVPQLRHALGLSTLVYSADGRQLASGGSFDPAAKLWDAATGKLLRTMDGHETSVRSIAFSPDGLQVVSGSLDGILIIWDTRTGARVDTLRSPEQFVRAIAVAPKGSIFASAAGKTVTLWDRLTRKPTSTLSGHDGLIYAMAFSPDGQQLVTGGDDKTVKLWDVATGRMLQTFEGHSRRVNATAFSPDGTKAASGGEDKKVKIWNVRTGVLIATCEGHESPIVKIAFSADGQHVLSSDQFDPPRLWAAADGALIRTLRVPVRGGQSDPIAFSPDARTMAVGNVFGFNQWDMETGKPLLVMDFNSSPLPVAAVAFSPDGRHIFLGGGGYRLSQWDAKTGRIIRTFNKSALADAIAVSPNSELVVSNGFKSVLQLWEVGSGRLFRETEGLAMFSSGHSGKVTSLAFAPDGLRIASASDDYTLKLWDATTGKIQRTIQAYPGSKAKAVTFSPDSSKLLSGSDDKPLMLWDAASGRPLLTFEHSSKTGLALAYAPNGQHVLSGGESRTPTIWDVTTGKEVRSLIGHTGTITSVAYSLDGRRAVSGSEDRTAKLWDVETGKVLRNFVGHVAPIRSIALSSDGRRILTGSADTTMRIWDSDTGNLLVTTITSYNGARLSLTPAGFFDGSGDFGRLLHIVAVRDVFTIDRVQQSLYNPDLVRETLAGDPNGEVREASKVINLKTVLQSGPSPNVKFITPTDGLRASTDVIKMQAEVIDMGRGVGRIEWRVNGVTAAVGAKPPGTGPRYLVSQELPLESGENVVEIVAYNSTNLLASVAARATIELPQKVEVTKADLYVLAVGINAYVDKGWGPAGKPVLAFAPLGLAVKDASDFGENIKRASSLLYKNVKVTYAFDSDATAENLDRAFENIAGEIHPRDTFILFIAGHGISENGRFYLIPQDYQSGPNSLARSAIGQDRLQHWLANRIKARKAVVLLDTCESGALVAGHLRARAASASEAAVGRLHEATGRPI